MKNIKIILGILLLAIISAAATIYLSSSKGPALGAVPTLDGVDNGYVSIGGNRMFYYSQPITATSSVICSVRNPFTSTSTLLNYRIAAGTTTSQIGLGAVVQSLDISTSSQPFADNTSPSAYGSSTPALVYNFKTTAAPFNVIWDAGAASTSNGTVISAQNKGNMDMLIGPGVYVTARLSTSTPGTYSYYLNGKCSGEFVGF